MPLAVKIGSEVGTGTIPAGLPGGAGSPGGPPAPQAGAGWEIRVLAAPDFHTLLAVIPNHMILTFQFAKQLKDLGSGSVTLDLDDPWWSTIQLPNTQPGSYLLSFEHVWQVYQDGVCRFEFLGETITEQLADSSEQRTAVVTGPGTIATLKWGMVAPNGFPSNIRYKLDAISDGFSEADVNGNLVLDTELWNSSAPTSRLSLNPSGTAQIMASPGATFLGTTAYDGTNTLISAQVSPIVSPDPAGRTLDGSEVTQMYVQSLANVNYYAMIALSATTFYCQFGGPSGTYTHTIGTVAQYAAAMSANQNYQYWQITETLNSADPHGSGTFNFYTSADGQNWAKQWSIVHNWDATNVALYFAAKYDVDNTEFATVTGINSDVTTSSLGGPLYFSKSIIGQVWLDQLAQAQARGTIPFITTGQLTSGHDSFGNSWTDTQSVQLSNGTDLYDLLGAHASMLNADWIMQPGFLLQVGIPTAVGKITLGTDRSKQVIFRDGRDCSARVRTRARDAIANLYAVINSDSRTVTATDATSIAEYGQREAWLQAAQQVTIADLDAVASAADLQTSTEVLSWTLQVTPWLGTHDIFNSYDVGDWVGLERPDFSAVDAVRVVAIAVQVNADGSETHELTLNSYIQWLQEQLQYIQNKLGGGLVNVAGTTAIPNSITNQNAPSVFSIKLGSLGDVTSGGPNGGAPLVYDPVTGQWMPAGTTNAVSGSVPMSIGGASGTVTVTGGQVTVAQPSAPPADGGASQTPVASTTTTPTSTTYVDANGVTRVILGQQSDGTVTVTNVNAPAPATPDAPTVGAMPSALVVGWDGLLASASPLSDFLWTEVHLSTTTGFTPSSSTLVATMHAGGTYTAGNLTPGTTYYCKLRAVNTSRVTSAATAQVSGVPLAASGGNHVTFASTAPGGPAVGDVWYDTSNGNEAHQWNGTSWVAYQFGTQAISFTASQIGGVTVYFQGTAPSSPNTGDLWYNTSSGNVLEEWNGTAWTQYQWGTASIANGAIGTGQINFTASQIGGITTTVSSTAPSSPHTGDLWYDGSSNYRLNVWSGSAWTVYQFGTNAIAAGSVTAALIAAGTITATQIAAGTITAANIQAATITGANVAANTISSANIVAGTITAADIAAGTITAANIASGAITATQIASGTITATQIASGTITATLLAAGIVKAGIVDSTTVTGSTLQNSSSNPRTSINPDGSVTITNSSGVVVFKLGPDGTMYWYSATGVLLMELEPGGTTLIYASSTGPQSWDFEGSTQSWAGSNATLADDSTWSATGVDSLKITHSNTSQPWGATSPAFAVVAGTTASMTCVLYAPSTTITGVSIGFTFWSGTNGTGSNLGTVTGDQGTFTVTGGTTVQATITGATVPASSQSATFNVSSTLTTSSVILNIDSVSVAGGLVYSMSPVAGTDAYGNSYAQGMVFTGLPGLTNVLAVQDPWGNTVAGIDAEGNISGQTINAAGDVLVNGNSLSSTLSGAAQGLVNYGYVTANPWPSSPLSSATTALFELDATVTGGRIYEFVMYPTTIRASTAAATVALELRYTTDGTTPTTSSAMATYVGAIVGAANSGDSHPGLRCVFFPTSNATYKFLVCGLASTGTWYFTQDPFIRCVINDLGVNDNGQSSNNMNVIGSGTSGGNSKQTYNKAYNALHTYWYQGSTGHSPNTINQVDGTIEQGGDFNDTYNGDSYSWILWPSSISSDLSGATINSIQIYLDNTTTWYNTGGTLQIGHTTTTSFPSTTLQPSSIPDQVNVHFNKGQNLWFSIPGGTTLSNWAAAFQTGGARSCLIAANTGDLTYYMKFQGGKSPIISFNYTK